MKIKEYSSNKASEVIELFQGSVHENAKQYYTLEQLEAWAPIPPDYHAWESYLLCIKPKLVVDNKKILGFLAFESNGHVDRLYVHKDHQRQGVATMLYQHIEQSAFADGIERLFTEASYLAKPFFEKMGFVILKKNNVCRDGILLNNFSMEKQLK
jgi:putative acetyltransferase